MITLTMPSGGALYWLVRTVVTPPLDTAKSVVGSAWTASVRSITTLMGSVSRNFS